MASPKFEVELTLTMTALLHQLSMDYIVAMSHSRLLTEDEAAIADDVRYALNREGFEVHWSSLGRDGLQVVHSREIHLILLDKACRVAMSDSFHSLSPVTK